MNSPSYLVKLSADEANSTRVWNGRKPFTVGHPVRWSMEREEGGVRIRSFGEKEREQFIRNADIEKTTVITLASAGKGESEFTLELRPVERLAALSSDTQSAGSALRIFHCKGEWAVDSAELRKKYVARYENRKVLTFTGIEHGLYNPGDLISVKSHVDGIILKGNGENTETLRKGEVRLIAHQDASGLSFEYQGSEWKLAAFQRSAGDPAIWIAPVADTETHLYNRTFRGSLIALAALLLISFLIPKAEEEKKEEKIQIVLKPKKQVKGLMTAAPKGDPSARDFSIGKKGDPKNAGRKGGQVAKSAGGGSKKVAKARSKAAPAKAGSKHVAKSNVKAKGSSKMVSNSRKPAPVPQSELFKTFSSAAFRKASTGVVSGGLASGVGGTSDSASEARRMGSAAGSGRSGIGSADGVSTRSAQLHGMGGAGDGDGGPGSAGAGYGRGSHSKVSGQGRSFVSLDTGASEVDEGLTRDQVGRVIHAHMSEIRYCYESAVLREDGLEGRMTVDFSIGAPGRVNTARVGSSTVSDSRLHHCIVSRLKNWKFPKPKGGVTVAVSYPFMFKTLTR